jgi:hypothetical protein
MLHNFMLWYYDFDLLRVTTTDTSGMAQHEDDYCGSTLTTSPRSAPSSSSSSSLDLGGILWLEHINLVVGSKELAEYFYLDVRWDWRGTQANRFMWILDSNSSTPKQQQQPRELSVMTTTTNNNNPPSALPAASDWRSPTLMPSVRVWFKHGMVDVWRIRSSFAQLGLDRMAPSSSATTGDDGDGYDDDSDGSCLTVRAPWGNIFHCYSVVAPSLSSAPHEVKGSSSLLLQPKTAASPQKLTNFHSEGGEYGPHMDVRGHPRIRLIEIVCPKMKAPAIARFCQESLRCTVHLVRRETVANVSVGPRVHLVFAEEETTMTGDDDDNANYADAVRAMRVVHLCMYAHDFRGLYMPLSKRNLIWMNPWFLHLDSSCDTYEMAHRSLTLRFKHIVNPSIVMEDDDKDGRSSNMIILELEHETGPPRHGQFMKVPRYNQNSRGETIDTMLG